jgi:hypothetical protein
MNSAVEIIEAITSRGGQLWLDGELLRYRLPANMGPMVDTLREHKPEIIGLLKSRPDSPVEGPLDDGWGLWLLEQCTFRDRWWGGTGALYLSLARWCADHGRPAPASRAAFVAALQGEGFQPASNGLVYGLVLKADLEAHERFQTAPNPARTTVAARRTRRPL